MPPGRSGRMLPAHDEGGRPDVAVDRPSQKTPPQSVAWRGSVSMNPASAAETPAASSVGRLPAVLLPQHGGDVRGAASSGTAQRTQRVLSGPSGTDRIWKAPSGAWPSHGVLSCLPARSAASAREHPYPKRPT
jgi:hypothetical protein